MTSVSLFWDAGRGLDVHVLAGETSPSLLGVLVIEEHDGKLHFATSPPPDIDASTFRFEPNFASLVVPPANGGITVDTATGAVTVAATRPAPPRLERFVIEASVQTVTTPPTTLGPIPIRVQVHDRIDDLWLTPARLTVRRATTGVRFSVLARFEDDTVGDITGRSGIAWSHNDPGSPSDPRVRVGPTGGLAASADAGTVTITASHQGRTATAQALAAPAWSAPVEAILLTSRSAGIARMAEAPNVLFLAEGFPLGQFTEYQALVRKMVDMVQDPATHLRPFDLFRGVVNYWMAFVPSPEAGTSPLYDMNVVPGLSLRGEEIPLPVKPTPGSTLTLENLIYAVGLPTPADATATVANKLSQWLFQYGPSVGLNVPAAVVTAWQRLHDHRLANEVDSAFGVAMGNRPQLHASRPHRSPDLHQRRVTASHLEALFANMFCQTAVGAPAMGAIWADPSGTTPAPSGGGLPTGLRRGQDRGLVYLLLGGARSGGSQPAYAILSGLVENVEVNLSAVAGTTRRVDVVPHALPATPALRTVARVAHEVSHALGLRDEYGESGKLAIPDDETDELAAMGNVQPAKELVVSAADPRLDPAKLTDIKWRWPRVAAAGVTVAVPAAGAGGTFVVRLRKGHAAAFRRNDVLRLRKAALLPRAPESVRLTVTARPNQVRDEVTVRPAAGFTPADWPAGSVLIRPVRGPATGTDPLGPDLLLVSQVILDHLGQTRIPLNRTPTATPPAPVCVQDTADVHRPSSTVHVPGGPPAPLRRPRSTQHIVGLYDAGATYFCGVFHPSGECLMRQLTSSGASPRVYPFCWVCAYFLVDRLDPTKHAVVERDFAKRYPRL